jgi:hypothetical protein
MEAALIQQMTSQDTNRTDPDAVIVAAMLAGNANAYASLQRYSAAAERSYYKAKQELERERARAAKAATVPPTPAMRPVPNEPKFVPRSPAEFFAYVNHPDRTRAELQNLTAQLTAEQAFSPALR